MDLVDKDLQYIHVKVSCLSSNTKSMISFVYVLHSITSCRPLWNNFKDLGASISVLWLIICDFNNILSSSYKCGGVV